MHGASAGGEGDLARIGDRMVQSGTQRSHGIGTSTARDGLFLEHRNDVGTRVDDMTGRNSNGETGDTVMSDEIEA